MNLVNLIKSGTGTDVKRPETQQTFGQNLTNFTQNKGNENVYMTMYSFLQS